MRRASTPLDRRLELPPSARWRPSSDWLHRAWNLRGLHYHLEEDGSRRKHQYTCQSALSAWQNKRVLLLFFLTYLCAYRRRASYRIQCTRWRMGCRSSHRNRTSHEGLSRPLMTIREWSLYLPTRRPCSIAPALQTHLPSSSPGQAKLNHAGCRVRGSGHREGASLWHH